MLRNYNSADEDSVSTPSIRTSHYKIKASNYLELPSFHSQSSITSGGGFPNSIGEYGMGRLLGRGAFGSVYEVTEIRHATPLNDFKYAIKIVKNKKSIHECNYSLI